MSFDYFEKRKLLENIETTRRNSESIVEALRLQKQILSDQQKMMSAFNQLAEKVAALAAEVQDIKTAMLPQRMDKGRGLNGIGDQQ